MITPSFLTSTWMSSPGMATLIAGHRPQGLGGRESPEAVAGEDPRDRRERHPQNLGDLGAGHLQGAKAENRSDPLRGGGTGDPAPP